MVEGIKWGKLFKSIKDVTNEKEYNFKYCSTNTCEKGWIFIVLKVLQFCSWSVSFP